MSPPAEHNHLTRVILDEGKCPGCDRHHAINREARAAITESETPTQETHDAP